MSLSRRVVNRPTTFLIIFALLVGFGLYVATDMAIDLFPDIEPPILVVFANYPGAGPEEVEQTVTRPMESALSNVSNIDRISSTSTEGSSQVMAEFTYGTDMSEAANDVRDSLEFVRDFLPDEVSSPMIFKYDPALLPILWLQVTANRSPEDLRQLAVDTIAPRIEQIDGVALASVDGGREKVIRVDIPQNRLEAYNLNLTQIQNILRGNNMQVSAGTITEGNIKYLVRTSGEFASVDELKNTVVAYKGSPPTPQNPDSTMVTVRLRDIADVYEGYRDPDSLVYVNGEPGVFVIVQKQSGTNSVQVADTVIAEMAEIEKSLPSGIDLVVRSNTTEIVKDSLESVSSSAILGGILAVIILFVFLRSIKSTLVVAVAIPISLVLTLMFMYFFDLTLNLMTLTGLALGVGMLVDNSIVIIENIYRYREKGAKLRASAILGSQEMTTAITASTLTTVSVFLPMVVFRNRLDFIGEMISGLAFTVVISLLSSLLVAAVLIPVLASKYVPLTSRRQKPLKGFLRAIDGFMERIFRGLDNGYKRSLRFVLRHKLITVIVLIVIFAGSLMMIPSIGFELMPSQEQDSVTVNVEMPIGTRLEVTESVLKQFELIVQREITAYEDILLDAGSGGGFFGVDRSYMGSITVNLPPFEERVEDSDEIKDILRGYFGEFPGAEFSFGGGGMNLGTGSPIVIKLKSDDLEASRETGEKIVSLLEERVPEVTEPVLNLSEGLPQLEIDVDRQRAYDLGLNIASIGKEIQANIEGVTAGRYREEGKEYDILLTLDEASKDRIPDLERIFVVSSFGRRVPLSSFASLRKTTGPVDISRENQSRMVTVEGGVRPGSDITRIMPAIQDLIASEIPAREGLIIEYGGDYEDLITYGTVFAAILIVAVLLVFGVMASQFESFLDPFIIFFTMPLTLIGVIGIHFLTGENLSLFTAVGMVVLIGIVVNNGIVLVDYTNLMRKRGLALYDACVEAGGNRLRPILMTSLTTILALLPVGFMEGEGASLISPIAKAVVGGLTVSTLLTLFLIPVLYAAFNGLSDRIKRRKLKAGGTTIEELRGELTAETEEARQ